MYHFWADWYILRTHKVATLGDVEQEKFQNLYCLMLKNILPWPCLLLFFFVNYFPHGSFLKNSYIHKQMLHGYKPVRAAKQSESWKDAASSIEGITQSTVNYLHHIITWSRFIKKSSRKSKDFHDLLHIQPSTTVVDPHHLKVKEDISPKIIAYLSAFKKSAQFISWFLRCSRF